MRTAIRTPSTPAAWLALVLVAACGSDDDDGVGRVWPVGFSLEEGSVLSIGGFPPFDYDGSTGASVGTFTALGGGTGELRFAAADTTVPPLLIVPPLQAIRVEIIPNDLVGTMDLCTGEVELAFDAAFQPVLGDARPTAISVVTALTTGTSAGDQVVLTGTPMDGSGRGRLVGVAVVPLSGDPLVDLFLQLPADAAVDTPVRFEFPEGKPGC